MRARTVAFGCCVRACACAWACMLGVRDKGLRPSAFVMRCLCRVHSLFVLCIRLRACACVLLKAGCIHCCLCDDCFKVSSLAGVCVYLYAWLRYVWLTIDLLACVWA